jgi:hypothetical protein
MDFKQLKERLDSAPVLDKLPDSKATEELHDLFRHPGLAHLWGLLLGARQSMFLTLSQSPIGSTGEIQRIGVIQGTIKGIELFRDTVLEQAMTSDDKAEGADA